MGGRVVKLIGKERVKDCNPKFFPFEFVVALYISDLLLNLEASRTHLEKFPSTLKKFTFMKDEYRKIISSLPVESRIIAKMIIEELDFKILLRRRDVDGPNMLKSVLLYSYAYNDYLLGEVRSKLYKEMSTQVEAILDHEVYAQFESNKVMIDAAYALTTVYLDEISAQCKLFFDTVATKRMQTSVLVWNKLHPKLLQTLPSLAKKLPDIPPLEVAKDVALLVYKREINVFEVHAQRYYSR